MAVKLVHVYVWNDICYFHKSKLLLMNVIDSKAAARSAILQN